MNVGMIWLWVQGLAGRVWGAIWASFSALFLSKAVWLAASVTFLGGFWMGHIQGAHFSRTRSAEPVSFVAPPVKSDIASNAKLSAATEEAIKWKAETEAQQKEVRRVTADLTATKAALAKAQGDLAKRPVSRVLVVKKPASEPAKAAWSPFER